ncbi:MAG: TIGR03790 family protein [Verrucomicrobia bacterium]|nr:TIGR03790 family protein [Verrucomicrobiota bacterium]
MPTQPQTLNSQLVRCLVATIISFSIAGQLCAADQPLTALTVVVYNKTAPDGAELARFYAQKRGIASDHIVGLTCSLAEEISRDEYDATIANRLREIFKAKKWWTTREAEDHQETVTATSIRFVALIKGMPLRIKAAFEPYPGDARGGGPIEDRNEASVDSELTTLGYFSPQISGVRINEYFKSFQSIDRWQDPALLLVCRLDAASSATVKQMITDAIAAEKNGLWGRAYVDAGGSAGDSSRAMGDEWLAMIRQQLHKVGVPVVYDDAPEMFPEGYPMTDCALYYGWYSDHLIGPFTQRGFHFAQGAIAVHIHSYSAATLRDPHANWVGPLLSLGAAASIGNVFEPYLQLTSHLDIFNDRLLHGFTFAESAYMSIQGLSWMSVMVGDPLYRPYLGWTQIENPRDYARGAGNWKSYHDFAMKNFAESAEYRSLARQAASRTHNCPMMEDFGLMEAGDGKFAAATSYFGQARSCYTGRDDLLRVIMEEADAWKKLRNPKRGLDLLRAALRVAGDAPSAPLLKKMEQEIRGVSTTPNPSPSSAR